MTDEACLFLRRKQTYRTLESRHALDDPADASAAVAQPGDPDLRRPPGRRLLCVWSAGNPRRMQINKRPSFLFIAPEESCSRIEILDADRTDLFLRLRPPGDFVVLRLLPRRRDRPHLRGR